MMLKLHLQIIVNLKQITLKENLAAERGPDKKPRTYRANSMGNLVQFKQRPEEFVQYLKDEKGVDVTGNSSILKTFLIFGGTIVAIFGGFLLYNHYKNRKNDDIEKEY